MHIGLEGMRVLLSLYTDPCMTKTTYRAWAAALFTAAVALGIGRHCTCQLWQLSCQYIIDQKVLPINPYGNWNKSMLGNEDIAADVNKYLQSLGTEITAEKLVTFLASLEMVEKHEIEKKITV